MNTKKEIPLIKLQKLYKLHRTESLETTALGGIDLEVRKGELVAVMGPSGCGKSTLLNVLGLIDTPDRGSYIFDNTDVTRLPETQRADLRKGAIGFVFQSFNLIDELNAYENIELPLLYLKVPARERKKLVLNALEVLQMMHRSSHYPQQLSGGQQQRIAIARALVINPRLILADEPTGNLDSENGASVMKILQQLNEEGTTIVLVTHSAHDAGYAERVINLFDGQVISESAMPLA